MEFKNLGGMSVTQRVKSVEQPRGGYIKPSDFEENVLGDCDESIFDCINVHASLIGMAVDYLSRFMISKDLVESFKISIFGAINIKKEEDAAILLNNVTGLDDTSIFNAIKLTCFDVVLRAGVQNYIPVESINPNKQSIAATRILVERTLKFFDIYGPIVSDGFTFEGGYTDVISTGDGDYLTNDTLWDLKVLKNKFNKNHTLQILIYWRMGLRSDYETFKNIKYLGIFNPRKNTAYRFDVEKLSEDIIEEIDEKIIGYEK